MTRDADPDPATRRTVLALVGRPNSGKSSLYNCLSGGDAHVGNYPGVTVDILEAELDLPGGGRAVLTDLPGVYSIEILGDSDSDEGITRAFLDRTERDGQPLVIIQVLDATQLGLGLRLTRELLHRPVPLLVVATQYDVLLREGREIDVALLQRELGVTVLSVSSRERATREQVLQAAAETHRRGVSGGRPRELDPDDLARRALRSVVQVDAAQQRRRERTARLDGVLLHPLLGPLVFLLLMSCLFIAVFFVSEPLKSALDALKDWLGGRIGAALGDGLLSSFLVHGVLDGAGTVLTFLPQIVLLTVAMELLGASGYLSRGAFLVDRALRAVGLGGRAFVPLLTGHACAVPAIAATRVIRDPRERLTAILIMPLMTCQARLPTYGLLITTFFAGRGALWQGLIFVGLYGLGLTLGLLVAALFRRTVTRGRGLPLVLEMPAYRTPEARRVAWVAWRATVRFIVDVGTVILVAALCLWALLNVPMPARLQRAAAPAADTAPTVQAERMSRSVAAGVGQALEPLTRPLGFDWRINVGLIASFGARELMVSTLGTIFGQEDADEKSAPLQQKLREARQPDGKRLYSGLTAASLLMFFVLSCQCMSTVAAIRRETRTLRWPLFVLLYSYFMAYVAALLVYQGGRLLGLS